MIIAAAIAIRNLKIILHQKLLLDRRNQRLKMHHPCIAPFSQCKNRSFVSFGTSKCSHLTSSFPLKSIHAAHFAIPCSLISRTNCAQSWKARKTSHLTRSVSSSAVKIWLTPSMSIRRCTLNCVGVFSVAKVASAACFVPSNRKPSKTTTLRRVGIWAGADCVT